MRTILTLTPDKLARLVDGRTIEMQVVDETLNTWHVLTISVDLDRTDPGDWKPLVLAVARKTAVPSL